MTKTICLTLLLSLSAAARVWVPEGTPVRVQLDQDIPRNGLAVGAPVKLSVAERVRVQGYIVVEVGAEARGVVVESKIAGGKTWPTLQVEAVRTVDGLWARLRTAARAGERIQLVRTDSRVNDRPDPKILMPHGATFAAYVDQSEAVKQGFTVAAALHENEIYSGAGLGEWSYQPSVFLCSLGLTIIILASACRFWQTSELRRRLMAWLETTDIQLGWTLPKRLSEMLLSQIRSGY